MILDKKSKASQLKKEGRERGDSLAGVDRLFVSSRSVGSYAIEAWGVSVGTPELRIKE